MMALRKKGIQYCRFFLWSLLQILLPLSASFTFTQNGRELLSSFLLQPRTGTFVVRFSVRRPDDDASPDERNNAIDKDSALIESYDDEEDEEEDEVAFLRRELAHLESLEEMLFELDPDLYESIGEEGGDIVDFDDDNDDVTMIEVGDEEGEQNELLEDPVSFLNELLESLGDDDDDDDDDERDRVTTQPPSSTKAAATAATRGGAWEKSVAEKLESALLQGVVPVSAGVGDDSLPGDFGFDPLHLSTKDVFQPTQQFLLSLLPGSASSNGSKTTTNKSIQYLQDRPRALILRDYREAEIRHSRLAMLAALIWPLQEMLDRLLLEPNQFGPLIYGPVTLPYFPLLMTLFMLLLGYLDIYSQAIKEMDDLGDAYLPGDCFWDPLRILSGTSDATKRRMQERELFNGRAAMLAILVFTWEEAVTHKPVIEIPGNELLFEPAYQIPFIQRWLDAQFTLIDSN